MQTLNVLCLCGKCILLFDNDRTTLDIYISGVVLFFIEKAPDGVAECQWHSFSNDRSGTKTHGEGILVCAESWASDGQDGMSTSCAAAESANTDSSWLSYDEKRERL